MNIDLTRRRLVVAAAIAGPASLVACASRPAALDMPPIVFVPGNGDTAALWMTTIWRFESNGWPRERLHAIDMPYPLARDDDTRPQPGRSSTAESMAHVAAAVQAMLAATGARRVALVGNSRGGYAIRNYIANGGGAPLVSHVVLGGTPNHGVYADAAGRLGNEFNGAGPFLAKLNAPQGAQGNEVPGGIAWMTIRSDASDKYAQPDGAWIGARGEPTHVSFDGPALKGAGNVVIAGVDHRETAFSPKAFAEMYRFIAGRPPATLAIVPEANVVLDGTVSGLGLDNRQGNFATNLPLVGAEVEVYATDAETGARLGGAVHRKTIGSDGRWGPFAASGTAHYEFVITAAGYATTHIYRSPFPRSSSVVSLRPERVAEADRGAKALVILSRPRGYFGVPRDRIVFDGESPPAGIPIGVPGISAARLKLADGVGRAVVGEFNGERIVGRAWPAAENNVVVLELTY
ncbi:MAG: alpha/beta fold hydrolase [Caldimonas sp.]